MENKDFFVVKILNEGLINFGVQNQSLHLAGGVPTPNPTLGGSRAMVRKLNWPCQTFPLMIRATWAPSSQAPLSVGEAHSVNKY